MIVTEPTCWSRENLVNRHLPFALDVEWYYGNAGELPVIALSSTHRPNLRLERDNMFAQGFVLLHNLLLAHVYCILMVDKGFGSLVLLKGISM